MIVGGVRGVQRQTKTADESIILTFPNNDTSNPCITRTYVSIYK